MEKQKKKSQQPVKQNRKIVMAKIKQKITENLNIYKQIHIKMGIGIASVWI